MKKILYSIIIAMMFSCLLGCSTAEGPVPIDQAESERANTTVEAENTASETITDTTETTKRHDEINIDLTDSKSYTWVVNTSSKKFHYEDCPVVDQISIINKIIIHDTATELMSQGYLPCQRCKPVD